MSRCVTAELWAGVMASDVDVVSMVEGSEDLYDAVDSLGGKYEGLEYSLCYDGAEDDETVVGFNLAEVEVGTRKVDLNLLDGSYHAAKIKLSEIFPEDKISLYLVSSYF